MTKKKSYGDLLKDELLEIARRLGLTNLSRLRKEEIVDLVEKASAKQERSKSAKPSADTSNGSKQAKVTSPAKATSPAKVTSPARATSPAKASPPKATSPAAAVKNASPAKASPPKASPPPAAKKANHHDATSSTSTLRSSSAAAAPGPARGPSSTLGPVSDQAGAVASKFTAATQYRPEELQGVDERLPELPDSYGDNRIVLMPRDLSWLFTYWDLTAEYKEAARAAGGSVQALRLYDVTGSDFDGTNAHAMIEHECADWARSWYIPTPAPDRDYVVEIGYRGGDQWFPLARSNRVSVPSDQPSTWIKDDFITIRFDEDLRDIRERLSPPPERPTGAAGSAEGGYAQTLFDDGELRIMVGGAFLPPSGAPTWPPFSGSEQVLPSSQLLQAGSVAFLPGSLGVAGSVAFLPGSLGVVAGSVAFLPGSLGVSAVPGSLYQLPSSGSFFPGAPFQLPSSQGFLRPSGPPASGDPSAEAGSSGATPGDGGPFDGGLSAGGPTPYPRPEPPAIVAVVEMVISGRSVPGADLRIAGRSIPMGPDGAFSLRVTVPEGLRELPIEARWAGGSETRCIKLRLGRESD